MKNKFIIVIILLIIPLSIINSKEIRKENNNVKIINNNELLSGNYFGLSAGYISGVGITYRYWPSTFGFQITFIPNININTNESSDFIIIPNYISFSINGLLKFYETDWSSAFFYGGLSTFYIKEFYFNIFYWNFYIGFGPGIEIYVCRNITFDIMFGYSFYFTSYNNENQSLNAVILLTTFECGLYYRF